MTYVHRITGDGESDDGTGVFGTSWMYAGIEDVLSCPAQYVEKPSNDIDPDQIPTYRSDTLIVSSLSAFQLPTAASVVGTVVTFTYSAFTDFPYREIGGAIVDADGVPYYVESVSGYDVTVDREGFATGQISAFYPPTPRTVTYGAQTEGIPILEKFYGNLWLNFQMLRGGRSFDVTTRAFQQQGANEITQTINYDPDLSVRLYDDLEYERRMDTPTDQSRAIGLQVTATLTDPLAYWQLGAMAFEYRPTSTRTAVARG
jgi:hypothetical protein